MKNKALISVTLLLLFFGVVGSIYSYYFEQENQIVLLDNPIVQILLNLGFYLVLYQLIKSGTITQTVYWQLMYLSVSITIMGALFKIQHWAIANTLLTFGLLSFVVIYFFRFTNKKTIGIFDGLKLIWVCSFFIIKLLIITHTIPAACEFISVIILIITYIYFVFSPTPKLKPSKKNITFISKFEN